MSVEMQQRQIRPFTRALLKVGCNLIFALTSLCAAHVLLASLPVVAVIASILSGVYTLAASLGLFSALRFRRLLLIYQKAIQIGYPDKPTPTLAQIELEDPEWALAQYEWWEKRLWQFILTWLALQYYRVRCFIAEVFGV